MMAYWYIWWKRDWKKIYWRASDYKKSSNIIITIRKYNLKKNDTIVNHTSDEGEK